MCKSKDNILSIFVTQIFANWFGNKIILLKCTYKNNNKIMIQTYLNIIKFKQIFKNVNNHIHFVYKRILLFRMSKLLISTQYAYKAVQEAIVLRREINWERALTYKVSVCAIVCVCVYGCTRCGGAFRNFHGAGDGYLFRHSASLALPHCVFMHASLCCCVFTPRNQSFFANGSCCSTFKCPASLPRILRVNGEGTRRRGARECYSVNVHEQRLK